VSRFEPEEVEGVLAHELGRHVAGDVWRGLAVQGAVTRAAFWVAIARSPRVQARSGSRGRPTSQGSRSAASWHWLSV